MFKINVSCCREFINGYTGKSAVYCICDGSDPKRIVVLGSQYSNGYTNRVMVFVEDCVDLDYPENNVDNMINQHKEDVGENKPRVSIQKSSNFNMYDY